MFMKNALLFILALSVMCIANAQLICVDPGHGGSDPGALGCGLRESDINLKVSKLLATALKNAGFSVKMTRSSDTDVSLSGRTSYANSIGASRFVSVHCNAFNGSAHGTETYCWGSGSSTSFSMRDAVNPKVVAALGTYNRGCKTANYYVVKYTNMPAILTELAFIDNSGDAAKLGNSTYQQKAANAIANGVNQVTRSFTESVESNLFTDPTWSSNGTSLFVREIGGSEIREVVLDSEVSYVVNSRETVENKVRVLAIDDQIFVEDENGQRMIVSGDEVYYNPVLSPDGTKIVYSSLTTGLYVCDLNGNTLYTIGRGTNPSWSADSMTVVYDIVEDDGTDYTASDIYSYSLETKDITNITNNSAFLAQKPALSPDGRSVAFEAQGKIYVAKIGTRSILNCKEVKIVK
jgi:N-acetylmuramoyl-L-alanine amidase